MFLRGLIILLLFEALGVVDCFRRSHRTQNSYRRQPYTRDDDSSTLYRKVSKTSFGVRHQNEQFDWFAHQRRKELEKQYLDIDIVANKTLLQVSVNEEKLVYVSSPPGTVVYSASPEVWPSNGVTVLVLGGAGDLKLQDRLHTFLPGQGKLLARLLRSLQPGRVVVLVALPEWILFLDPDGEEALVNFGFEFGGEKSCNFEAWAGAAVVGSSVAVETIATTNEVARPFALHFFLPMNAIKEPRCNWHSLPWMSKQVAFCRKYDGYGDLCQCQDPFTSRHRLHQAEIVIREEIPFAIVTANSPRKLYRTLRSLFTASGASQTNFLLVVDGPHAETVALADTLGISFVIHSPQGVRGTNVRINTNIRFALESVFDVHPKATKAVILEDDLLVSPDIIRYFQATSWLLDHDPSVFAVNAFSYNSMARVAADVGALRRVEAYPYYGWMMARDTFQTFVGIWANGQEADWDKWMQENPSIKRGRDVIIPEISRTFHDGGYGVHVSGFQQETFYHQMLFNDDRDAQLQDLNELKLENYERFLMAEVQRSEVISLDVYSNSDLLPGNSSGPFVTFVRAGTTNDEFGSLAIIMMSLGTYYLDAHEMFRGLMLFNISGRRLYVVGCPVSRIFCKYNPHANRLLHPSPEALELVEEKTQQREVALLKLLNRRRTRTTLLLRQANLENIIDNNRTYISGDIFIDGSIVST